MMRSILAVAVLLVSSLALAQGTYTPIDYPGAIDTVAEGIDTPGDIVGYFVDSTSSRHGFLLSNGTYTQLDVAGTISGTAAFGINDAGQIVGATYSDLGLFVYSIQTQMYSTYQYGSVGSYTNTTATGIDNSGTIVGYTQSTSSSIYIGLELQGSTFHVVRVPAEHDTYLTSINNGGEILAVAMSSSGTKSSYLVQGTSFKQLVVPGVGTAVANAMNDSGVFAGDYNSTSRDLAFEWQRKGPFKPISEPHVYNTFANGINSLGQVVGYYLDSNFDAHGFLWTPDSPAEKK